MQNTVNEAGKAASLYGILLLVFILTSCAGQNKSVQKLTKPVDQTAEDLFKIRELKSDTGETRAVVSPADEGQFKIKF
ncbi:MAG: hypothetical protein HY588_00780 [Candidatus Omnitrophica bacterium]|nr:hypothetical protein [Candidatus Omnitrophota bacterium]